MQAGHSQIHKEATTTDQFDLEADSILNQLSLGNRTILGTRGTPRVTSSVYKPFNNFWPRSNKRRHSNSLQTQPNKPATHTPYTEHSQKHTAHDSPYLTHRTPSRALHQGSGYRPRSGQATQTPYTTLKAGSHH